MCSRGTTYMGRRYMHQKFRIRPDYHLSGYAVSLTRMLHLIENISSFGRFVFQSSRFELGKTRYIVCVNECLSKMKLEMCGIWQVLLLRKCSSLSFLPQLYCHRALWFSIWRSRVLASHITENEIIVHDYEYVAIYLWAYRDACKMLVFGWVNCRDCNLTITSRTVVYGLVKSQFNRG